MALITAPQFDMPSNEYEFHTVIIDTFDHTNKIDFTSFLPTPLENVVQAQLMAATITSTNGTTQTAFHIGIEELRSYFSQRGKEDLGDSTDNHLNGVFGTIIGSHVLLAGDGSGTKVVLFKNDYPIIQSYHNPIRKLDRLTFNIDKQDGTAATVDEGMFIFSFTCKKKNLA
jgi:hypothetical protein